MTPAHYICSKCGKDFIGPDYFELPILCKNCKTDHILKNWPIHNVMNYVEYLYAELNKSVKDKDVKQ